MLIGYRAILWVVGSVAVTAALTGVFVAAGERLGIVEDGAALRSDTVLAVAERCLLRNRKTNVTRTENGLACRSGFDESITRRWYVVTVGRPEGGTYEVEVGAANAPRVGDPWP